MIPFVAAAGVVVFAVLATTFNAGIRSAPFVATPKSHAQWTESIPITTEIYAVYPNPIPVFPKKKAPAHSVCCDWNYFNF